MTGINTPGSWTCCKEAKIIDMMLDNFKILNILPYLSITYVVCTYWHCLKEAIPICTHNICLQWVGGGGYPLVSIAETNELKHNKT